MTLNRLACPLEAWSLMFPWPVRRSFGEGGILKPRSKVGFTRINSDKSGYTRINPTTAIHPGWRHGPPFTLKRFKAPTPLTLRPLRNSGPRSRAAYVKEPCARPSPRAQNRPHPPFTHHSSLTTRHHHRENITFSKCVSLLSNENAIFRLSAFVFSNSYTL